MTSPKTTASLEALDKIEAVFKCYDLNPDLTPFLDEVKTIRAALTNAEIEKRDEVIAVMREALTENPWREGTRNYRMHENERKKVLAKADELEEK